MFPAREEYLAYLRAYHRFHRLKVQFEWEVARVSRRRIGDHEGFALQSSAGRFLTCKYLIVATALGRPYVPDMEGIELADGYESVDVREEASEGGGRWDRVRGRLLIHLPSPLHRRTRTSAYSFSGSATPPLRRQAARRRPPGTCT